MENIINTELEMEMEEKKVIEEDVDFDIEDDFEIDDPRENEQEVEPETIESFGDDQEVDLSGFVPSVCDQQSRLTGDAGVMSIVNSKNGMRVSLSKDLMDRLDHPKTVQIGFADHQIAISGYLGEQYTSYSMSKSGAKRIIYRSELVKQITERYGLDFTSRTSITFAEVSYRVIDGNTIALIKVRV